MFSSKELSKEDCDDEDECGSADGVFSNDGSGDEGVKGLSPSKDKVCMTVFNYVLL
jgi:hypothetical protein